MSRQALFTKHIFITICCSFLLGFFLSLSPQSAEASSSFSQRSLMTGTFSTLAKSQQNPTSLQPSQKQLFAKDSFVLVDPILSPPKGILEQSGGFGLPRAGTMAFNLLVVELGLVIGNIVISIGTSIAASYDADLTPWKIAGLTLDTAGLLTSILFISLIDKTQIHPIFIVLMWASVIINAISLGWGIFKLVRYVDRRQKYEEQKELQRHKQGKPVTPSQPEPLSMSVLPWGNIDQTGNLGGGLAVVGRF